MKRAQSRLFDVAKSNKLFFLNTLTVDSVEAVIREGVMIGAGNLEAAETGRRFTKRTLPW